MSEKIFIERPPRIEPELPSGTMNIPNPPDAESDPARLLQEAFLPLLMIMGYFLASIFGQGRNMLMMIFTHTYRRTRNWKRPKQPISAVWANCAARWKVNTNSREFIIFIIIQTQNRHWRLPRICTVLRLNPCNRIFARGPGSGNAAPATMTSCIFAWG